MAENRLGCPSPKIDRDVRRHVVVCLAGSGIVGVSVGDLAVPQLSATDFIAIPSTSALRRGELSHTMAMLRHFVHSKNMRLLPTGFAGREISLLRMLPQRIFLSFSRPEARRMVLL